MNPSQDTNASTAQQNTTMDPKEEFSNYVHSIAKSQRLWIADRIDAIQAHERRYDLHLVSIVSATTLGTLAYLWKWGPRRLLHKENIHKPLSVGIPVGILFFYLYHNYRGLAMKANVAQSIGEFEYEIKRVNAHYVEAGANHLAWLQFMLTTMGYSMDWRYDTKKIRKY